MSDIVERLNKNAEYVDTLALGLCAAAADEITRLRAQMESGNYLTEHDKLSLAIERQALEIKERDDTIASLRASNAKLGEALRPFALLATHREMDHPVADDGFPINLGLMNGNVTQSVIRNAITVADLRRALSALTDSDLPEGKGR